MKLSFVISTQPTKFQAIAFDPNFEANVARLAELGFDGVELGVREPDKLDVVNIKRILDKHKLVVPAIGTGQAYVEEQLSFTDPDAWVREQAIARIKAHIELASVIASGTFASLSVNSAAKQPPSNLEIAASPNASRLLAMTNNPLVILGLIRGKVQPGVTREQIRPWLVEAMRIVAREAQAKGVRLAIEPINRYETDLLNTAPEALGLIEEIGADNVGVLFDTFHANIEEARIETGLRICGARLFHVHLADSNRWYPGAGHTDFSRILATLREMKYDGWVSAEILPKPSILIAAEQTMRTMKQLM